VTTALIRWGVLGTAGIAVRRVIPAMQGGRFGRVTAIASRDLARARAAASSLGIDRAYGSYDDLLAAPDVDAVYIPLPNHLHVPWSIRSLEAGKHVLCEKPIGLTSREADELIAASVRHPGRLVMEAFMYRFHPQWQAIRRLVTEGAIGRLRSAHTLFGYYNVDPANIRNQRAAGGGALMDIGCYGISVARFLFDAEPTRAWGVMESDPTFETDRLTSAVLEFDTGMATFTCATQSAPCQRVDVLGTDGRIEVEIPFNPPADRATRILVTRRGEVEEVHFEASNQYTLQADRFAEAALSGRPVPTPLADAVANMRVVDAIRASFG